MAVAQYGAFLPIETGQTNADEPVGIDRARYLFSTAQAACEGHAQVRVAIASAATADDYTLSVDVNSAQDSVWYRHLGGQFDCHLHPVDGCFRFRVRIAGYTNNASAAAGFRLSVGPEGFVEDDISASTAPAWVLDVASVTATTTAWLTATGSKTYVEVPAERVGAAIVDQNGLDAIGGREIGIPVCRMSWAVWSRSADISVGQPVISGVMIQEYVGL